jgi:NADH pyrophosphatase NudC (nudix superfamily)
MSLNSLFPSEMSPNKAWLVNRSGSFRFFHASLTLQPQPSFQRSPPPLRCQRLVVRPTSTCLVTSHSNPSRFRPGDHPDDYRYLFEGHRELLTELESRAWTHIIMQRKIASTDSPTQRDMMQRRWLTVDDAVSTLLQHGEQSFFTTTLERVLREQPDSLRTCPRCGSLCRTSRACLCPHCSHTWFDQRTPAASS